MWRVSIFCFVLDYTLCDFFYGQRRYFASLVLPAYVVLCLSFSEHVHAQPPTNFMKLHNFLSKAWNALFENAVLYEFPQCIGNFCQPLNGWFANPLFRWRLDLKQFCHSVCERPIEQREREINRSARALSITANDLTAVMKWHLRWIVQSSTTSWRPPLMMTALDWEIIEACWYR